MTWPVGAGLPPRPGHLRCGAKVADCTVTSNGSYTLPVPHNPVYSEKDPAVDSTGTATATGKLATT
jgi:hypothetical protein